MKKILIMLFMIGQLFGGETMSIYDIEVKNIDGQSVQLEKYKGRVMLIVITPPINNLNYAIILDGKNRRKKIITKRVV
jgi:hypothetical protein